jgi:hypothetical protein
MSRINWKRAHDHQRMRQHGVEAVSGDDKVPFELPPGKRWRRRMSKAELRAIADAAVKSLPLGKR